MAMSPEAKAAGIAKRAETKRKREQTEAERNEVIRKEYEAWKRLDALAIATLERAMQEPGVIGPGAVAAARIVIERSYHNELLEHVRSLVSYLHIKVMRELRGQ